MHVVYIHQYFTTPDQRGGTRSYEMARRLIRAGHRVSMICGNTDLAATDLQAGQVRVQDIDGIEVHRIGENYSSQMSFQRRWLAFLRFGRRAAAVIKQLPTVNLVFATSTPLTVGDVGRSAARHHRCPFVFEVRDLWPELPIAMGIVKNPLIRLYLRRMESRAYRAAASIIALAPGIAEGIVDAGYPRDRIHVIPNSSDVDLFQPASDHRLLDDDPRFGQPGDFRLVFTGAHGLANGLDAVLDAAAELKRRGVSGIRFCFIGSGSKKPRLMDRAKAEGLMELTSWIDSIPKRELARLLPHFDVGMMILKNVEAFYRGTSPNKFFDYLACGLPVLNNYPGWVAEYIEQHACGCVVPPDDASLFADTVLAMKSNHESRADQGRNARRLAETVFNRDILGGQLVAALESVNAGADNVAE